MSVSSLALWSCSLNSSSIYWSPSICSLKFKKECFNCFWSSAWVSTQCFSQLVVLYNNCISWIICLWFSALSFFLWTCLNIWYLSLPHGVFFLAYFQLMLTKSIRKLLKLLWYAATSYLFKYSSSCFTMLNGILLLRLLLTFWLILIFCLLFRFLCSVPLMPLLVWSLLSSSVSLTYILMSLLSVITVVWITVSSVSLGAVDCWLKVLNIEDCIML